MDQLVEWFGKERCSRDLERVEQFWNGQGRCLASITSMENMYRQLDDLNKMAELAVENLKDQARLPGVNIPTLIADFGTVTTAKYWGGKAYRDSTGENISIERAAKNVDEALAIEPKRVDDPEMDAALSIKLYRDVCRRLNTSHLWVRAGDLQGPLNTASLVVSDEEFLIELYTKPQEIHQFLGIVADFLIDYVRYTQKETDNHIAGAIWPWIFQPPQFGFGMTEDMMPFLSPDLYKEFGVPYVKRMTDALGPVQIHCCGKWGHHAQNLATSGIKIRSVEFWYPHTTIQELKPLADKGVVFVPYISLDKCPEQFKTQEEYYRHLLKNTPDHYRYWFSFVGQTPEGCEFIRDCPL
jgi:uroporphyrinogen-III decarboxylase